MSYSDLEAVLTKIIDLSNETGQADRAHWLADRLALFGDDDVMPDCRGHALMELNRGVPGDGWAGGHGTRTQKPRLTDGSGRAAVTSATREPSIHSHAVKRVPDPAVHNGIGWPLALTMMGPLTWLAVAFPASCIPAAPVTTWRGMCAR